MNTERLETGEGYSNSPAMEKRGARRRGARWLAVAAFPLLGMAAAAAAAEAQNNTLDMPFVRIAAGEFMMGNDESPESLAVDYPQYDRDRFVKLSDEAPVHTVRITRDFHFGKTEVTRGQFRRFIEASGYVPESVRDGTGGYGFNRNYDPEKSARGDAFEGRDQKYSWLNPGFPQNDDHPVTNVTWSDAVAMAEWLSKKEGVRYRLPTEAEWEYACRAGTQTRYSSGNDPRSLIVAANVFDADSAVNWEKWKGYAMPLHDGYAFTAPVASFAPNAFGLYDMHGNVWEWTADWHGEDSYAKSPIDDPQGPETGKVRVRRGGSWHTWPFYARSAFRNWNTPQTRYTLVGFRLVREVEAGK